MAPIALLSVSDKKGLIPLAQALIKDHGFKLVSSGGTAKLLIDAGLEVTRVADYTGAPEILEGRVKTLHPHIHGGILAKRNDPVHKKDLENQKISEIDLVVVNLYPFQETIKDENVSWEKAIENIDIGGPTMIRAAAKNHAAVSILTRPDQYDFFLKALDKELVNEKLRRQLALEAFEHTATYDIAISRWMEGRVCSGKSPWLASFPLKQTLRYGENPHQSASWYSSNTEGLGGARQLQGKELSTNNLLDLEAAISTVREFGFGEIGANPSFHPAAVVVKHTNPCGVAISETIDEALKRALDADRVSAFGGIVAINSSVNSACAKFLTSLFLECVVAPYFESNAKEILSSKPNLRLLELDPNALKQSGREHSRSILGGVLVQEKDDELIDPKAWVIATTHRPSVEETEDLSFAWSLVRHVRSNAIVVASSGQSLGIGAGQMNRIGAAKIALEAAGDNATGAVLASDGFFPFDDTVRLAAEHGIKAIIQPGGSIRDEASIAACNELGIAMLLTGKRHFLH